MEKFNSDSYINIQHAVIFPETMDLGNTRLLMNTEKLQYFRMT